MPLKSISYVLNRVIKRNNRQANASCTANLARRKSFLAGWLVSALMGILPFSTFAGPWVEVGDEQTRHHLTYLRDTGAINIPLSTWPLPWADIAREVRDIGFNELNDAQMWSLRYIKHAIHQAERSTTSRKRIYGGNSLVPFTRFSSDAKDDAFIASENNLMGERFVLNVSAKAIHTPIDGDDYQFDGSYLAATAGNWIFGLGAIERWWGPGWQSSLILSNSARARPGIFLRRKEALGFELPGLQLLGPWNLDAFAERLRDDGDLDQRDLFGARLSFSPSHRIEIGVSGTVLDGNVSQSDPLSSEPSPLQIEPKDEESLRQFSYDARVRVAPGFSIYGQALKASSDTTFGSTRSTLLGVEGAALLFGIHNRVVLEVTDSRFDEEAVATNLPQETFDQAYRYKFRSLGESEGYWQRKLSLAGEHFLPNGHQLSWRVLEAEPVDDPLVMDAIKDQGIGELVYHAPINERVKLSLGIFTLKNKMTLGEEEVHSGAHLQLEYRP